MNGGIGALAVAARSGERVTADTALVRRLWSHDTTLWPGGMAARTEIANRLGWLTVARDLRPQASELVWFARDLRRAGFTRAYLLGMGGSSLAPEVLKGVFGTGADGLDLTVLDTTDPAAIRAAERDVDLHRAVLVVSSKSGSTIEVESLYRHFATAVGGRGAQFLAITDPGTTLQRLAWEYRFRRVFTNPPDIGGRYSALSYFGLVPAALLGVDVGRLMDGGIGMARQCAPGIPPAENPGLALGRALAGAAEAGNDKLTLLLDWRIAALGLWIEQLVAESTGKDGNGIVPVPAELPLAPAASYGADRVFVATSLGADWKPETAGWLAALEKARHPVVRLHMETTYHLGGEFFRWEFATAVASALLGLNAFDQPNVQEAKDRTRALLKGLETTGALPGDGAAAGGSALAGLLGSLKPGRDYLGILAFLPFAPETDRLMGEVRAALRDRWKVPVTFGYGPRYLHSTGQLHKGGPASGSFLIVTCDHAEDLPVPGSPWPFSRLERAQALGDLAALAAHGRPVVRLHLPDSTPASLERLCAQVRAA